ncbi:MAG: hypothetical protein KBG15_08770 [Kofleriaceae bacterium]|nr:hypothetical protein [Kofleriaceae bacterium]
MPALTLPIDEPTEELLREELSDALALHHREVFDRNLDAHDPGELREHVAYTQQAIDVKSLSAADFFRAGDDMFGYLFRPENGLGNQLRGFALAGQRGAPNLRRVANGEFGGPEAMACADCHSVGGDDGAGSLTQGVMQRGDGDRTSSGDLRSAPALLGVGPVQRVAQEMTQELSARRADAVERARVGGVGVTVRLTAKGLAFGELTVAADGQVDVSKVTGVAGDLVVRPFGWKGHQASLRGMIREAFRLHMGMVSTLTQQRLAMGQLTAESYGDGGWSDIDRDTISTEVDDGMASSMTAYLAQLEVPVVLAPTAPILRDAFARGRTVFAAMGCATCHAPSLILHDSVLTTAPEMNVGGKAITIDVARDGLTPKVAATTDGYVVELFSDLRRHRMGPQLASQRAQPAVGGAIAADVWLTRPLWGLADSAPYLHDGRAATVTDAILAHGGEADGARAEFVAAPKSDQKALAVFLLSLGRTLHVLVP